jgi:hypothetical protein
MACNKCKGMTKLIGFNLKKCEICGNEQELEFKTSKMWQVRQAWKRLMHRKI